MIYERPGAFLRPYLPEDDAALPVAEKAKQ
jgi:hypothetical protein